MDVQAYRDAATREFGMEGFYAKYLQDLPPGTALPSDGVKAQYPDMAGGQVTLAWTLYEQYRDRDVLETAYPDMKRFVDRNATGVPGLIWPADKVTDVGDQLARTIVEHDARHLDTGIFHGSPTASTRCPPHRRPCVATSPPAGRPGTLCG
ncbi:hypothetical protein ACFW95_44320 [Streptomyces sp. NPDC059474]|uniref:alpha-L-rhamnosidase-related protein n=1 Tax=Streptomyces sp. NPDC059474 TaxID=3346846 RepID=UPI0036D1DADA